MERKNKSSFGMEFVIKTEVEIHCSTCKYYYCNNASMYCSHPKKSGKVIAARKNGCKYWENGVNKQY